MARLVMNAEAATGAPVRVRQVSLNEESSRKVCAR